MEDLNEQISKILSDPQSMQQLQSMASALGLGQSDTAASQPTHEPQQPDAGALSGILGALGGSQPAASPFSAPGGITPEMLQAVSRIAPLLSQVNREDESTRLLHALRPLLGTARQKKLDEAIKILQMMRLMPLLKESGVFSGLLSGLI